MNSFWVFIMQKFFKKNINKEKTIEEMSNELKVKEYINKYIKELQRHFDVSDNAIRQILQGIRKDLSPINIIKTRFFMLKSKWDKKIKEH